MQHKPLVVCFWVRRQKHCAVSVLVERGLFGVLVSLGSCNRIPSIGELINNRNWFLTVQEGGDSKIKVLVDLVSDESLLLLFFFLLYNIVLVLLYINMNLPLVYMCSPSWTPLPPPSPYHPSGSSQCTSPKHPVSCIEPRLVIHFLYDIIHVSMPFSQIIPPSPSPTESKRLF